MDSHRCSSEPSHQVLGGHINKSGWFTSDTRPHKQISFPSNSNAFVAEEQWRWWVFEYPEATFALKIHNPESTICWCCKKLHSGSSWKHLHIVNIIHTDMQRASTSDIIVFSCKGTGKQCDVQVGLQMIRNGIGYFLRCSEAETKIPNVMSHTGW